MTQHATDTRAVATSRRRRDGRVRRGATRRELMQLAGRRRHDRRRGRQPDRRQPAGAGADAEEGGRIRVAGAAHHRHARPGEGRRTPRTTCATHVLQRAHPARRAPDAAARRWPSRSRPTMRRSGRSSCARACSFHDGKPLTSADVVYSLIRHKDPAVGSKAQALAEQIDGDQGDRAERGADQARRGPNADLPVDPRRPRIS